MYYVLIEGSVADNIRYGPQLKGKKLSDEEVHELLALADLDSSFYTKSGGELSVGQAQRVALARTLANDPQVLVIFTHVYCNLDHLSFSLCCRNCTTDDPNF